MVKSGNVNKIYVKDKGYDLNINKANIDEFLVSGSKAIINNSKISKIDFSNLNITSETLSISSSEVNLLDLESANVNINDTKILGSISAYDKKTIININNSSRDYYINKMGSSDQHYISATINIINGYIGEIYSDGIINVTKGFFDKVIYNNGTLDADEFYYDSNFNITNYGIMKIKKGTINSSNITSICNSGQLYLGEKDNIYNDDQVIISGTKALENKVKYSNKGYLYGNIFFYDGKLISEKLLDWNIK